MKLILLGLVVIVQCCKYVSLIIRKLGSSIEVNLKTGKTQSECVADVEHSIILQVLKLKGSEFLLGSAQIASGEDVQELDSEGQVVLYPAEGRFHFDLKCVQGPCEFQLSIWEQDPEPLVDKFKLKDVKVFELLISDEYDRHIVQIRAMNQISQLLSVTVNDADVLFDRQDSHIILGFQSENKVKALIPLANLADSTAEIQVEQFKYNSNQAIEKGKWYTDMIFGVQTYTFKLAYGMISIRGERDMSVQFGEEHYAFEEVDKYVNYVFNSEIESLTLKGSKGSGFRFQIHQSNIIELGSTTVGYIIGRQNFIIETNADPKSLVTLSLNVLEGEVQYQIQECGDNCVEAQFIPNSRSFTTIKPTSSRYMVSVEGQGRYSLKTSIQQEDITLKDNEPYEAFIHEEEVQYYTYYLEDIDDINRIAIRVSSPSVQVMASNKVKLVTWDNKQQAGTSDYPIIMKKIKKGAYYIAVEGLSVARYSITVEVTRSKLEVIDLRSGLAHQSSIGMEVEKQCFRYIQQETSLIHVSLHGANHKLQLLLKTSNTIPTDSDYDQKAMDSISIVASKLVVCVQALFGVFASNPSEGQKEHNETQSWMNESLYNDIQFRIMIYNARDIVPLEFNQPHIATVSNSASQKFSFLTYIDEDYLYLTKNVLTTSADVNVYIGDQPYERKDEYEYQFEADSSTRVIDTSMLRSLCKDDLPETIQTTQIWSCDIFVLLTTTSLRPIRYSLVLHKEALATPLQDGQLTKHNLEHIKDFKHFYFIVPSKASNINIFASTFFGQIQLHISLWTRDESLHKSEWPFPNAATAADFSSGEHNQIHKTITTASMDFCWPNCLLLISVSFQEDTSLNEYAKMFPNYESMYDDTFSIQVTQVFQELVESQKVELTLEADETKYFTFKNLQRLSSDSILAFSLMGAVGNGFFSMTINGRDNVTIPSIQGQYDLHSDGSYLQVHRTDIDKILTAKAIPIDEAYLIIEVGGFYSYFRESKQPNKLEFSIYFLNEDIIPAQHGVPHSFVAKLDTPVVIQYFQYAFEDIFIRIQPQHGYGYVKIYTCKSPLTVAQCLKDDTEEIESFQVIGSGNSQKEISKTHKDYCIFCTYLIEINASQNEFNGQITIMLENDFVKLTQGFLFEDYIDDGPQRYMVSQFQSEIEIILTVSSGSPVLQFNENQNFTGVKQYKPQNNKIRIIIPPKEGLFQHRDIFLLVTGVSRYTIIYYTSTEIFGTLQDGRIQTLVLSEQQKNATFIYEHYDDVNIFFEVVRINGTLKNITVVFDYIKKLTKDDYEMTQEKRNMSLEIQHQTQNTITYKLPNVKGIYEITLIYEGLESPMLEIALSARDLKILPVGKEFTAIVSENDVQYLEAYAPKDGYLVMEINTCKSPLQFSYSQDQEQFLAENYTNEVNLSESTHYLEIIDVEKGTLWVALHSQSRQDAYASIKNFFYLHTKEIPHGKLQPGRDGEIKWQLNKSEVDEVIISFEHVECPTCKKLDFQVDYHIFIAQDREKLNMFGYCGSIAYDDEQVKDENMMKLNVQSFLLSDHNDTLNYKLQFSDLITFEYVYVGVKARVLNFQNSTNPIQVFYNRIEVPVPNMLAKAIQHNRLFFSILISAMILLIGMLMVWLCFYMKRYNQARRALDMQQTNTNIVGMNAIPAHDDAAIQTGGKQSYDTLEEDYSE